MRHLMTFACVMLVANLAFAQKKVVDPSYSVNNYKHPNKAAYARTHNLDNTIQLQTAQVADNRDYKHPTKKAVVVSKGTFATAKPDKKRRTEKHPFGL